VPRLEGLAQLELDAAALDGARADVAAWRGAVGDFARDRARELGHQLRSEGARPPPLREAGGETRRGALSAITMLSFARDTGGPTVVPANTLVGTRGGVTFATVTPLLFESGQTGPLQVAALARLLDVEADAVAREAAARLRAAVDEVVGIAIAEGVAPTELDAAVRRRPWPTREPGEVRPSPLGHERQAPR
jgi:hypothetical protein